VKLSNHVPSRCHREADCSQARPHRQKRIPARHYSEQIRKLKPAREQETRKINVAGIAPKQLSSSFGIITSTRFPNGDFGSARQLQLGLKLMF
jgi:hypothetical protein